MKHLPNIKKAIRCAAINLLAHRDHSTAELIRKLRARHYSPSDIQAVIDQLVSENLINNARFVENYIDYRRRKGYGPLRIQAELIERGITEKEIENHLCMTHSDWLSILYSVWQKRFKSKPPTDLNTRLQQSRFLQYRGFTYEQVFQFMDRVSTEKEI